LPCSLLRRRIYSQSTSPKPDGVDHAPAMLADESADRLSLRAQRLHRCARILCHAQAVANGVGAEDGGQLPPPLFGSTEVISRTCTASSPPRTGISDAGWRRSKRSKPCGAWRPTSRWRPFAARTRGFWWIDASKAGGARDGTRTLVCSQRAPFETAAEKTRPPQDERLHVVADTNSFPAHPSEEAPSRRVRSGQFAAIESCRCRVPATREQQHTPIRASPFGVCTDAELIGSSSFDN
jgi:hypothetical protein